ncbi:DBH-like monooxygenase protein 2 homolog [Watersipora subatra]|uniref:DBH-like monooxygenase protein 2 homolog n=1 Tax=Watersipora subatra TaxID=2589382 RepID=UPI00355B36D6
MKPVSTNPIPRKPVGQEELVPSTTIYPILENSNGRGESKLVGQEVLVPCTTIQKMKLLSLLVLACCGLGLGKPSTPNSFSNWLSLDPHDKFNVSWTVEGETITFTVTCETTGWVGLGFSPSGSMAGADLIVAWAADDGTSHLLDMYAASNTLPTEDTSQDVTLISASEANGVTRVQFRRKLDTCDKAGDNIITTSTTRLLYAYQLWDPEDNKLTSADYHGATKKGSKNIYLLDSKTGKRVAPLPDDVQTFDITVKNYTVAAQRTTYYCGFTRPLALDDLHHIIAIEPLVTKGNEGLAHHMALFGCYGVSEEQIDNNNITEGACYADKMPEFISSCSHMIQGWAVGGGKFYFPENTGYPFGGTSGGAPNYFKVLIHYDNPDMLNNFVDSSGFRLTYTHTIQDQEASVFRVGAINGIAIPPTANSFKTVSYCDSKCSSEWIPEEGIEVYGYLLHTHLLGRAIHLEWYRDGKNMGLLAFDDTYDFNFQETRNFEKNIKMLPGDSLKITCTYDSTARDFVTYGGSGTLEEMCLAYLFYYPRQNFGQCGTVSNLYADGNDPVYGALSVNASSGIPIQALNQVTDWTKGAVDALQQGFDEMVQYSYCDKKTVSIKFDDTFPVIDKSNFPELERKEEEPCSKDTKGHKSEALKSSNSAVSTTFSCFSFLFQFILMLF